VPRVRVALVDAVGMDTVDGVHDELRKVLVVGVHVDALHNAHKINQLLRLVAPSEDIWPTERV